MTKVVKGNLVAKSEQENFFYPKEEFQTSFILDPEKYYVGNLPRNALFALKKDAYLNSFTYYFDAPDSFEFHSYSLQKLVALNEIKKHIVEIPNDYLCPSIKVSFLKELETLSLALNILIDYINPFIELSKWEVERLFKKGGSNEIK